MLQQQTIPKKSMLLWLWPLMALTIGVRMIYFNNALVSKDCDIFLQMANAASLENWQVFYHGHPFHPLYPYLMAKLSWLVNDPIVTGRWISMFFGTLALVPLFFLTTRIFNYRIAVATGVFFALQPYLVGSATDVLSDSTYICLFLFSAWTAYEALRENSRRYLLALSGMFAGLAYLARPEGAGLVICLCLWLLVSLFRKTPELSRFTRFKKEFVSSVLACILIVGSFLVVALPYMIEIHGFTKKKPVWEFFGVQPISSATMNLSPAQNTMPLMNAMPTMPETTEPSISPREQHRIVKRSVYQNNIIRSGLSAANNFIITYHYPLAAFWLIGFIFMWRREWRNRMGVWFLFLLSLAYLFVAFRLLVTAGYCSKRHLFSSVVLMLPVGGLGVIICADILHNWLSETGFIAKLEMSRAAAFLRQRFNLPSKLNFSSIATFLVLCVAVLSTMPKTFKNSQEDLKNQAVLIKEKNPNGSRPKIISRDPRLAIMVPGINLWPNITDKQHIEQALQPGTWIVLDLKPEDRELAEEWLRKKLMELGIDPLPNNPGAIIYYVPDESQNPPSKK